MVRVPIHELIEEWGRLVPENKELPMLFEAVSRVRNKLLNVAAGQIRSCIESWLDEHRKRCINPDCLEPYNLLGFLAHCLGIRASEAEKIAYFIQEYESTCPDCQHLKKPENAT
jgi:hypothetical protein